MRNLDRFARLDILVNNAGVMLLGTTLYSRVEEWDRMIALNVEALLHVPHAAVPYLIDAAVTSHRRVATSSTSVQLPAGRPEPVAARTPSPSSACPDSARRCDMNSSSNRSASAWWNLARSMVSPSTTCAMSPETRPGSRAATLSRHCFLTTSQM
jgi:NAD(P)-dependent dehydrogenase (short-subunit alcohol dehydrogenase family)